MSDQTANNTDREIWRMRPDDFYSPTIRVNAAQGIGIEVGGTVIVKSVEDWHALAVRLERAIAALDEIFRVNMDERYGAKMRRALAIQEVEKFKAGR